VTGRPKLTLERTFNASIAEVWELWTTKEGIEAWWGPDGFSVAVSDLDLRPGGKLSYAMTATGPDQIDYVQKAGMPITTQNRVTFTTIDPPHRLVYKELADFIPGVKPYEVETIVELNEVSDGVHLLLTFEAMHDEHWTQMARLGREGELERLAKLLAARS
jgi:uncharacterized protein YndB with AHSA1/START domain